MRKVHIALIIIQILLFITTITLGIMYFDSQNELKYSNCIESSEYPFPNMSEFKKKMIKRGTSRAIKDGCIKDGDTAVKIAGALINSIYEDYNDKELNLIAEYDSENDVWLINPNMRNTTDPSKKEFAVGGGPHIVLKASNAQVIAIWFDK